MIIGWDSARRPQLGRVETSSIKDKSVGSDDNDRIAHRLGVCGSPHSTCSTHQNPFKSPCQILDRPKSLCDIAQRICKSCFPQRPSASPLVKSINYVNVLDFPLFGPNPPSLNSNSAQKPFTRRCFADIRYTLMTPIPHNYPSVTQAVLRSSRVVNTTQLIRAAENCSLSAVKKRAVKFLFEMKTSFSKVICKVVAYILFKVFRRIMSHLLVCPAEMEQLQEAEKTGVPILYLPLHRSHLDYLLITWTVWHWGLRLPHVASGDNLNLSGFGWLLRATGAFFIRRRVGDSNAAGCDQLYRSVLNSYMTEILRQGMPIEFFLEGTRSRFGKTLLPKNGLISNIVNAVQDGAIRDVWLVPVSFTYDETTEGIFFNELMGMRKERESVWRVFKGILQSLGSGRCGAVRISFGAPVLLSDYLGALKEKVPLLQEQSSFKHELRTYSYRELLPWKHSVGSAPNSTLIRSIGYHVVYDAQMQLSIGVGSVLSAVMLCKYRVEGCYNCVFDAFLWLSNEIVAMQFELIGWSNDAANQRALFQRALKLLDDCLFEMDGNIVVRNSHQNMLHLAYHKNALIHTLSIHSAVALAALTLRSLQCTEALLIEISWLICDLLQYEFLFCKPCENLRERIKRVIEGMKNDGLLKAVEGDHLDASWNILIPDSDAECKLLFYSNLLRPFLQSIYIVLQKLIALTTPFEGKGADFVRDILSRAHSPIVTPFALLNEALNADSFSNALRLFHEKKVLAEAPTVGLANVEQANELLKTLDTFLRDSK